METNVVCHGQHDGKNVYTLCAGSELTPQFLYNFHCIGTIDSVALFVQNNDSKLIINQLYSV